MTRLVHKSSRRHEEPGVLRVRIAELARVARRRQGSEPDGCRGARAERVRLCRLQRDLAIDLGSATTIGGALKAVLDAALRVTGIDCGGIYFVHEDGGDFELVAHKGLSRRFVEGVRCACADTPTARLAFKGTPLYCGRNHLVELYPPCGPERIRSLACIPVVYHRRVLAILNLASRHRDEIPLEARDAIEAVAAQIGGAIARIRSREALQRAHDELNSRVRERTVELQAANDRLRREIAERKRAEHDLREAHSKLKTTIKAIPDLMFVVDGAGRICDYHAPRHGLLYMPPERFLGKPYRQVLPDSVARVITEALREAARRGWHRGAVYSLDMPTGRCWFELSIARKKGGRPPDGRFLVLARDITDRRKAEDEKARLDAQVREAQKMEAVGRLAGGIAHDFNNLMATVLGLASLLRSRRAPADREHALLSQIEEAADTAGKLAHQLLIFAKGGRIVPSIVPFSDVIRRALRIVEPALPHKVKLSHRIPSGLCNVECDGIQIQQVILNLCRNAVEAMPRGGRLRIVARNAVLASTLKDARPPLKPGRYACLSIRDTGCGITPEDMKLMFEPFFTTKEGGHGLGLPASFGALRAHHGAISVESEPRRGSTFSIWLPQAGRPTRSGRTPRSKPGVRRPRA